MRLHFAIAANTTKTTESAPRASKTARVARSITLLWTPLADWLALPENVSGHLHRLELRFDVVGQF